MRAVRRVVSSHSIVRSVATGRFLRADLYRPSPRRVTRCVITQRSLAEFIAAIPIHDSGGKPDRAVTETHSRA